MSALQEKKTELVLPRRRPFSQDKEKNALYTPGISASSKKIRRVSSSAFKNSAFESWTRENINDGISNIYVDNNASLDANEGSNDISSNPSRNVQRVFRPLWAREDPNERERDPNKLLARQKQIDFGKNTIGYDEYLKKISKNQRKITDPWTPEKNRLVSKRAWDGQVRSWRRQLHRYDPNYDESMEDEEERSNDVLQIGNYQKSVIKPMEMESSLIRAPFPDQDIMLDIFADYDLESALLKK